MVNTTNSSSKQQKEVIFDEPVKVFNTERIIKTNQISNALFSGIIFFTLVGISLLFSANVKKCLQQAFSHKPISSYFNKKYISSDNSVAYGEPGHIFSNSHDIFEEKFEDILDKKEKNKEPQELKNNDIFQNEENPINQEDSEPIFNSKIVSN